MDLAGPSSGQAVKDLREELRALDLQLEVPGVDEVRSTIEGIVGQIDDYLLPRLEQIDAPLLAVVGGSTGSGKSTLVNSLIGRVVSPAGVLRPTTTTPILVANPADLGWFEGSRILPDLPRLSGAPRQGDRGLYLVGDEDVPRGLALLDAPDVDSVVEANRILASQLLSAADLWLFTTTASRYADAVPWGLLRMARERSTALALVLNRVPEEALHEVPGHLREMLEQEGLRGVRVITIPEVVLADELIPFSALAPLREWLDDLASDAEGRKAIVRSTLRGALRSLPDRARSVAVHLDVQTSAAGSLAQEARRAYERAVEEIESALGSPALLRGEVLARWHEFIGTADLMRSIQSTIGRVRDRIGDVLMGRPPVEAEVRSAVGSNIELAVTAACDKAVERVHDAWRATPQGAALLAVTATPDSSSSDLSDRVDDEVRGWQSYVLQLVSEEGQDKRAVGRAASLGVNAVGAALMIAVFAHTGGLTGGEIAVAGGTAALSQRLLEALFGDQAVRTLTNKAREDLTGRLRTLVEEEAARFESVALDAAPSPHAAAGLRAAAERIEEMAR